jgi:hypothetical protein
MARFMLNDELESNWKKMGPFRHELAHPLVADGQGGL